MSIEQLMEVMSETMDHMCKVKEEIFINHLPKNS